MSIALTPNARAYRANPVANQDITDEALVELEQELTEAYQDIYWGEFDEALAIDYPIEVARRIQERDSFRGQEYLSAIKDTPITELQLRALGESAGHGEMYYYDMVTGLNALRAEHGLEALGSPNRHAQALVDEYRGTDNRNQRLDDRTMFELAVNGIDRVDISIEGLRDDFTHEQINELYQDYFSKNVQSALLETEPYCHSEGFANIVKTLDGASQSLNDPARAHLLEQFNHQLKAHLLTNSPLDDKSVVGLARLALEGTARTLPATEAVALKQRFENALAGRDNSPKLVGAPRVSADMER